MSTRSAIGYQFSDNQFNMIYCHYDGYPEHVGKLLVEHWNSFDACDELVMGPQIRNFDNDGQCVRFGDSADGAFEVYESITEILSSGFDYCYVYDRQTGWHCFTERGGIVITKTIPGDDPAAAEPTVSPARAMDAAIDEFIKTSDAKFSSYAHAAGYLSGLLSRLARAGDISDSTVNAITVELHDWVLENKA